MKVINDIKSEEGYLLEPLIAGDVFLREGSLWMVLCCEYHTMTTKYCVRLKDGKTDQLSRAELVLPVHAEVHIISYRIP